MALWQAVISAASALLGAGIGAGTTMTVASRQAKAGREADDARWLREKRDVIYRRILADVLALQHRRKTMVERLEQREQLASNGGLITGLFPPEQEDIFASEVEVVIYGKPDVLDLVTALKNAELEARRELSQWNRFVIMPPALVPTFAGVRFSTVRRRALDALARADSAVAKLTSAIQVELNAEHQQNPPGEKKGAGRGKA